MLKTKRIAALALASSMVLSLAACGGTQQGTKESESVAQSGSTESKVESVVEDTKLEWMNYDSEFPIVKEGYEKTLSMYVLQSSDFGDPEDSWVYKWLTNECNINLEITAFTSDNQSEIISLAFASDELPDVIIGAGFSTTDLLKYGVNEEQIIDIAPYVNEDYMPNLTALYADHPEFRNPVTDSEGRMWSLGYISNPEARSSLGRAFINYDWMEELGLTAPETLDEFTELMRAFKEAGYAKYPIGGSYTAVDPSAYFLNALGYVGNVGNGGTIALRNGEVVLPYYDREGFSAYLQLMKQYYEEGLIHPDFYTMDSTTTTAVLGEGTGFLLQAPTLYTTDYQAYWGATPLTSDINDTRTWWTSDTVKFGSVVITSACEDPELAARVIDIFYNLDNEYSGYRLAVHGPQVSMTDILYGVKGWELLEDTGKTIYYDYEDNKDKYDSLNVYMNGNLKLWNTGLIGVDPWHFNRAIYAYYGESDYLNEYTKEEAPALRHTEEIFQRSGDKCWGTAIQFTAGDYVATDVFPSAVYFDADLSAELIELKTAMDEYAYQEIAKFVTGARALNDTELDDYFSTLKGLGADEYLQNYADYYKAMKSN